MYITRHPTALAHLNALPQTNALTAYLAQTRTLASSLTHAWDLSSLLIKPVQRLLKYPLLLAAIIDETTDSHGDKENLKLAKQKMEEVARGVNEGRRRWEVVQEVLMAKPGEVPMKKGLNVGVTASVNIGRMRSLRSVKAKEGNEEAVQVEKMEKQLKMADVFVSALAKAAIAWGSSVRLTVEHMRDWAISFGKVIGLSGERQSEAFNAFLVVLEQQLMPLCTDLELVLKEKLLRELARLIATSASPLRLLAAMNTLEPLHYGLLNINVAKTRPPAALLEASQSYVALRGQLCAELPQYLALLDKGIVLTVNQLSQIQTRFYADVRDRWSDLWEALRVEGEMNAGVTETLRVWWDRWGEVDKAVLGLKIVYPPKRALVEAEKPGGTNLRGMVSEMELSETSARPTQVVSMLSSLDPVHISTPMPLSSSLQRDKSRGGSNSNPNNGLPRRYSNDSLRSGKSSGRSGKSRRYSRPDDPGEYVLAGGSGGSNVPASAFSRNIPGGTSTSMHSPSFQSIAGSSVDPSSSRRLYEDPEQADDWDRGRIARKPSLRRKLTDSLLPSVSHRRRSSSAKSMDSAILAREREVPSNSMPPAQRHARANWDHARPKYACRVVHPCYPPNGVSYCNFPFFQLEVGEVFQVLKEAGHPCTHEHLPLYVDDGEDCLLLVRDRGGQVGWALASFLIPED
jgi:dynamin-binding protein